LDPGPSSHAVLSPLHENPEVQAETATSSIPEGSKENSPCMTASTPVNDFLTEDPVGDRSGVFGFVKVRFRGLKRTMLICAPLPRW
jgi:hypothetical protein